jgi:hypothetical protein
MFAVHSRGDVNMYINSQHFLDSWLTDGDGFVSLARLLAALNPQKGSWYSFLLEAESTPGP